jgi:hypothetical protein
MCAYAGVLRFDPEMSRVDFGAEGELTAVTVMVTV